MAQKADQGFVNGPVDDLCGNPGNLNPGGGTYNGVEGYPKRSEGGPMPEKLIDKQLGE